MPSPSPGGAPAPAGGGGGSLAVVVMANVVIAVVMFGIASAVTPRALRTAYATQRHAFGVGLLAQLGALPAAAFAVARGFGLAPVPAFTVLALGCAPGGTTSNVLAYWAGADLPLSLALTSVSNLLAFGTVPLLLFAWSGALAATADVRIPFGDIALSLGVVLVPAAAGLWLRARRPRIARAAERVGSTAGAVVVVAAVAVSLGTNWDALGGADALPGPAVAAVAVVAPLGALFACGALLARRVLGCGGGGGGGGGGPWWTPEVITVCLETGVQNVPLALAVTALTLRHSRASAAEQLSSQLLIAVWSVVTNVQAVLLVVATRWCCPAAAARERRGSRGAGDGGEDATEEAPEEDDDGAAALRSRI